MAKKTTEKVARKANDGIRGRKIRIGMIGAGGMANAVHYPSLASFDDVELVGVCDLDEERLRSTCDKYNIPPERRYPGRNFNDFQKMLNEQKPDGVYVIGQPDIMYNIWCWCLEQGYPLYIEKPMGLCIHQARNLSYLAEKNKLITQVSHQRRTSPLLRKMREECLKRGPITHAICEFYKCAISPMLGPRDHMMDDGTHAVDTVRWMCGGEVVNVESHCKRIGVPDINWIGATLHFDNGSTGYVLCNWASGRRILRVEMHAPNVCTDAEVEGKAYLYADGNYKGVEYDCREVAGGKTNWEAFGFRHKNREFIDSLKTGKEVTSSPFRDCVKTMEVCEKILAQALLRDV